MTGQEKKEMEKLATFGISLPGVSSLSEKTTKPDEKTSTNYLSGCPAEGRPRTAGGIL